MSRTCHAMPMFRAARLRGFSGKLRAGATDPQMILSAAVRAGFADGRNVLRHAARRSRVKDEARGIPEWRTATC